MDPPAIGLALVAAATPACPELRQPGAGSSVRGQERHSPRVGFFHRAHLTVARRRARATGNENTMPHDKIKAATRTRIAETGEPYSVARRAVIGAHRAAQNRIQATDAPVSADPVAPPIGSALGDAIGQAFKQLDLAAPYRSQIAEINKMISGLAAAQVSSAVGQAFNLPLAQRRPARRLPALDRQRPPPARTADPS